MPLSRTEREQRIWDAAEYIANEVEKFMQQDPVLNTVETLGMDLMEIAGVTDGKDVHAFCHMIEQRIYAAVAHKLTEPVDLDDLQLDFPTG